MEEVAVARIFPAHELPRATEEEVLESPGRFTSMNISDADDELLDTAGKRLNALKRACPSRRGSCERSDAHNRSGLGLVRAAPRVS
jgi:hypothetical protein